MRAATGKVVRGNNRITPLGGSIGTTWTRASWRGRGAGGTLLCGLSSAWALLSCLPRGVVEASTCGSKMGLNETRRRRWRTPPTLTKKGQGKGNGACCTPMELGMSCGGVIYCRANTTDRCIIASASNLHAYSRPLVLFVRARAADTDSKTGDDGRSRGLTISHAVDYGPPGGCSNACHACSRAEHPGGSELACCVVDFVQGQNTCRCANRAATRRCRDERWLCYFWEWNQLGMRDVQPRALHGWDKHVLPSCAMRLLSSTHDFACATGLGM